MYKTDKYAHSILMKQDKSALKWLTYQDLVEGTQLTYCIVDFMYCLCSCHKYLLQSQNVTVLLYCGFYVLLVQLPQVLISITLLYTNAATAFNSTLQYTLDFIIVITTIARYTM